MYFSMRYSCCCSCSRLDFCDFRFGLVDIVGRGRQRHQPPFGHFLGVAAEGSCCHRRCRRSVKNGQLGLNKPLLIKREPGSRSSFGVIEDGELGAYNAITNLKVIKKI